MFALKCYRHNCFGRLVESVRLVSEKLSAQFENKPLTGQSIILFLCVSIEDLEYPLMRQFSITSFEPRTNWQVSFNQSSLFDVYQKQYT